MYQFEKTSTFGNRATVVITAPGLKRHIVLIERGDEEAGRPFSVVAMQRGGRGRSGGAEWRYGPLDDLPKDEVVRAALAEHGLDAHAVTWSDIEEISLPREVVRRLARSANQIWR